MENASKALIIAGAILLAILLISLGIMIFSQAQDTVSNSGMNDAAKTSFNNRLLKYEGTNKKGSEVKALINEVNVINSDDTTPTITLTGITTTSAVNTSHIYTVKLTPAADGANKGLITQIEIKDNSTVSGS